MKKIILNMANKALLLVILLFTSFCAFAQEEGGKVITKTSTTHTSSSDQWYTAPWMWVVGAGVFILLLVAILRSNSSSRTDA